MFVMNRSISLDGAELSSVKSMDKLLGLADVNHEAWIENFSGILTELPTSKHAASLLSGV